MRPRRDLDPPSLTADREVSSRDGAALHTLIRIRTHTCAHKHTATNQRCVQPVRANMPTEHPHTEAQESDRVLTAVLTQAGGAMVTMLYHRIGRRECELKREGRETNKEREGGEERPKTLTTRSSCGGVHSK